MSVGKPPGPKINRYVKLFFGQLIATHLGEVPALCVMQESEAIQTSLLVLATINFYISIIPIRLCYGSAFYTTSNTELNGFPVT